MSEELKNKAVELTDTEIENAAGGGGPKKEIHCVRNVPDVQKRYDTNDKTCTQCSNMNDPCCRNCNNLIIL